MNKLSLILASLLAFHVNVFAGTLEEAAKSKAIEAFEKELRNPNSNTAVINEELVRELGPGELIKDVEVVVLTRWSTATNYDTSVIVVRPYIQMYTGGGRVGTLTALFRVSLVTDASTGAVQSHSTVFDSASANIPQ